MVGWVGNAPTMVRVDFCFLDSCDPCALLSFVLAEHRALLDEEAELKSSHRRPQINLPLHCVANVPLVFPRKSTPSFIRVKPTSSPSFERPPMIPCARPLHPTIEFGDTSLKVRIHFPELPDPSGLYPKFKKIRLRELEVKSAPPPLPVVIDMKVSQPIHGTDSRFRSHSLIRRRG
jgi:hypothetical protein